MLCPKPVFQQASGAKRARKGKVRLVRNKLKQCVVQINAAVVVLRTLHTIQHKMFKSFIRIVAHRAGWGVSKVSSE